MSKTPVASPGFARVPDYNMAIRPAPGTVIAVFGGEQIAASAHAWVMEEQNYPPVYYLPKEDIQMELFSSEEKTTQ